ncbi:hypothetical protein POM88_020785 [Heracleum sosnowskyi]|uniref:RRM domain-containing protein n=1 Tax=Heracleum sosnowskyi TaxID=360622 RepID=A0AAD8IFQ4_9APIA|nr:hypothetical protein POM88_020785 [Heracleum sosnowskyi]
MWKAIQKATEMVYVASLDASITDSELLDCFKKVGEVLWSQVSKDKYTSRSLGDGYVCYSNSAEAERAITYLNSTKLKDRTIHIYEYYGYVTFDSLQAAAKAATALPRQFKAVHGMTYYGKFLVDTKKALDIVAPPVY